MDTRGERPRFAQAFGMGPGVGVLKALDPERLPLPKSRSEESGSALPYAPLAAGPEAESGLEWGGAVT